jgi:hypothetical protein
MHAESRKQTAFVFAASVFTIGVVAVALLALFIDDRLLMHSGPAMVVYLLLALALPGALVALGVGSALPAKARPVGLLIIEGGLLTVLAFGIAFVGYERLIGLQAFGWITFAALAVASVALGVLGARDSTIRERGRQLSFAAATVGGAVLLVSAFYHHLIDNGAGGEFHQADGDTKKHVVFVVIDGLPPKLLNSYKPSLPETEFDIAARQGRLFERAYTERTYTNGFYALIWNGFDDASEALITQANRGGRKSKWVSFHANGIPDTSIPDYEGLRSGLLTENYRWLPQLLGLDYNVFLAWPSTRLSTLATVVDAMNDPLDEEYLWDEVIPQEIAINQAAGERTLTNIHITLNRHSVQAQQLGLEEDPDILELVSHAAAEGYTYPPDMAENVEKYAEVYKQRIDWYGKRIMDLWSWMQATGRDRETVMIVTADHGSILERGMLWYGPHPVQEVMRVPLVVYGVPAGRVAAPVSTRDVSATMTDVLGISGIGEGARSLLSDIPESRAVGSKTVAMFGRPTYYMINTINGGCRIAIDEKKGTEAAGAVSHSCFDLDGFDQTEARQDCQMLRDFSDEYKVYFNLDVQRLIDKRSLECM